MKQELKDLIKTRPRNIIDNQYTNMLELELIKLANNASELGCSNCANCELDDSGRVSEHHFCTITEEKINDIEQHFCEEWKED